MTRRSRALWAAHPTRLDDISARIVRDVERDGIALTSVDELFGNAVSLRALIDRFHALETRADQGTKKAFLKYLWERRPLLDPDEPFLAVARSRRVLDIVNAYLGMCAKLHFYSANVTIPAPDGEVPQGSQRWHRDPGGPRMLKLFLYLSDVDEIGAGPLMYVKGTQHGGKWQHIFPRRMFGRLGCYPAPGAVKTQVPESDIFPAMGSAGTIIFCDTLGLHRGGYSTTKERRMFTASYIMPGDVGNAWFFRYTPETMERIAALDPVTRFALTPT